VLLQQRALHLIWVASSSCKAPVAASGQKLLVGLFWQLVW
jgi:hypothetical protein